MLHAVADRGQFKDTSTRPHLVDADNGKKYVVKFAQNQDRQSIIAEYVCGKLARMFGLCVADPVIIMFDRDVLDSTGLRGRNIPAGPHLGTELISDAYNLNEIGQNMPPRNINNLNDVPAMISFDIFTSNRDRNTGNVMLVQNSAGKFDYFLIDHGRCFEGPNWDKNTLTRMGYELRHIPWDKTLITGITEFRAPAETMTSIEPMAIQQITDSLPREWIIDTEDITALILEMSNRSMPRILQCVTDKRSVFPQWTRA